MHGDQHTAAGVSEGDVLAGKYRIDRVLGVGGMGVVVAAHHIHLDERVAIKFMRVEALTNRDAVGRFAREARAAVKIKSEHVCRVSDVGTLENGAPYMVMEYLEGIDLAVWLQQRGSLAIEQAVDFTLQACEAIAEAHSIGIVHRDLKPANLFVIRRPDGVLSVKVLDFGISKVTGFGASGSDLTQTSAIMGSPLYMSPEQMQSTKDVDPRADIWALGVILYELVGGALPFIADTMPELVLKVVSTPPGSLRDRRLDVPPELESIISRCLEKNRNQRYATVGELAAALLPFGSRRARASVERISGILQGAGMSTSPLVASVPPGAPVVASPAGTQSNFGHTSGTGARTRTWLIAGVVAVLVVVGAGAVLARFVRSGAEKASAADASAPPSASELPPVVPEPLEAVPTAAPSAVAAAPSSSPVVSPPAAASVPVKATVKPSVASKTIKAVPEKPVAAAAPPAPSPPAAPPASKPGAGLFNDRK